VTVRNPYFSSWAGQYPIPSMILAGDLSLLWSNSAADEILAAAKDFQLINGVVACLDKVQGQEFRAFLEAVGQKPEVWLYGQDETAFRMVRAEALSPDGMPPALALMIYPVDGVERYLWSDFHKVFGLTRAETIIVKRIVGGEPADVIAEELSITLETVRTHVRRIYAKLGVNNREQLFSKVSAFRTL
jgi:DNA-binding CsgD family transcriptional regulator